MILSIITNLTDQHTEFKFIWSYKSTIWVKQPLSAMLKEKEKASVPAYTWKPITRLKH